MINSIGLRDSVYVQTILFNRQNKMASDDPIRTRVFSVTYLACGHPVTLVSKDIHNLQSYLESFLLDVLLDWVESEFS